MGNQRLEFRGLFRYFYNTIVIFSMQYPKKEIRERIVFVAKNEFLAMGFKKSSLRKIARDAGMTTGGIYSYFLSKEAIFDVIVNKVAKSINQRYELLLGIAGIDNSLILPEPKSPPGYQVSNFHQLIQFIHTNREELSLLFFHSRGTSYENFHNWLVQNAVNETKKILMRFPADNSHPLIHVSDFFLENIVGFNLSLVREMLLSDISFDTMLGYESEISSFFFNGWKALLKEYSD